MPPLYYYPGYDQGCNAVMQSDWLNIDKITKLSYGLIERTPQHQWTKQDTSLED